jgi:hypothetical protein
MPTALPMPAPKGPVVASRPGVLCCNRMKGACQGRYCGVPTGGGE